MRILFIGSGDIGLPAFRWLIESSGHEIIGLVTQPDRPVGRHQILQSSPVKQLAVAHRIPVLQPEKIRATGTVAQIREPRPDVIVVMAYGQLLPTELLKAPAVACLNLHASLLPRHRGAAPIQAAILAGDPETGITVMHVAEGLDTGDILLSKKIPVRRRETGGTLHDRLAMLAPVALAEALALLGAGAAPRVPQDGALATCTGKLTRENGRIDWRKGRLEIDRKIRAMNPWPAASTTLIGADGHPRTLKIYTAISVRKCSGHPGEVLRADRNGLLIAADDGGLLLREVQLEGKKRMTARNFLTGHPIIPGAFLG